MNSEPVVDSVRRSIGRDVSRFDELFLARTVARRLAVVGAADAEAYQRRLDTDQREAESLWDSLLVSHSEFFREPLEFALLEEVVLPELIRHTKRAGQRELRVWSAGCAAGQEPYSLAILLDALTARSETDIGFRIFATDVSEANLAAARSGVYHEAAVQNVRLRHLHSWFSRQGNSYALASRLRERVSFSAYDLLDERTASPPACIFGDFDLIVCGNVMFYYREQWRQTILGKILRNLRPGGYFATSGTEREMVQSTGWFRLVAPPAAVFERPGR